MKKTPPYHIKQEFLSRKLSPRAIAQTMNSFKKLYDYDVLLLNLPEIFKINSRFPKLIWGELFPKSLDELGSSNQYYYQAVGELQEMYWVMVQVSKNRRSIEQFIVFREKIYNDILLGEYEHALSELEHLRAEMGVSVWYLEMKVLIYCFSDNESKCFEILEDVNKAAKESKQIGKTGFVPYLLHFLFLRTSEFTTANFENELNGLSKRNRDRFQAERLNYFKLRLNYLSTIDEVELRSPLVYEAPNSLIDRYETMVSVIRSLFITSSVNREKVSAVALRLYKIVGDSQLLPIAAFSNKHLPNAYYNSQLLPILNDYYGQKYEDVIRESKALAKVSPNNLDNIRLYIQSLILLGRDYSPICPGNSSIINIIAKNIYLVLTEQDNHNSLMWLKNFNKRLYGLPIAGPIHCFVSEQNGEDIPRLLEFSYNTCFDPHYCRVWEMAGEGDYQNDALSYLKEGKTYFQSNLALEYYLSSLSDLEIPKDIAPYRVERDNAIREFSVGNYNKCIEICQTLLNDFPSSLPICQMATEYMFKCYEAQGKKMEAISFYVDQFIAKQSHTNKVRLTGFVNGLRNDKYKNLKNNIDLQIFVLLNAAEDEQRAHVLEKFMDYKEIEDGKGLIEEIKEYKDQIRVELFLSLLIEGDVMRHLSYIESTSQMLNEQQVITQFLTSLDSPHHNYYVDFNKQLVEQTLIYSNIEKLDESRIYVNADALVKYDLVDHDNLYVQLLEISKTLKLVPSISFLNLGKVTFLNASSHGIIGESIQTTKNASMDLAAQLFDAICYQYLFSKYGLKTYLSTRIRHGVLEGEIRAVFDLHYLVLLTEGARYRPIEYWRKSFGLNSEEQGVLMGILADFSKELLLTIESFKENVVQIKTCEEDHGMFNYVLSEEEKSSYVFSALQHSENYQEFCWAMCEVLNTLTEFSLISIRDYIKNDFSKKFNEILGTLEKSLSVFSAKHFYSDLQQAVSDSRADIQGKLVKIEKWFRLQSGKFDDFDLAGQLNLVWDVIAKQYPNINYKIRLDIDDARVVIKAEYYLLISDILTILYNNMYNHGSAQSYDNVAIAAKRDNDNLLLHFENLTQKSDSEVNDDLQLRLASNRCQQEHGSGLSKVKNIVLNELGGNSEDLIVFAQNGKCNVDIVLHLDKLVRIDENTIS